MLWATPLPLFLAGLSFGMGSALVAALIATLLVALTAGSVGTLVFAMLFALPVPLLIGLAMRSDPPRLDLSGPLALFGLGPVAVLLVAALWMAGDGGLEAAMRRAVEGVMQRLGLSTQEALISTVVRLNAAAFGLIATAALALTATLAQRVLARRGLARARVADLALLRLPTWYPVLPLLGAAALLAAPAGRDAVAVSTLLLLLLPPFYLGIIGVHLRARARQGRVLMLGLFYVLLLVFLQLMAPLLATLGLLDHFRRRRGAAPT
jgi:hypothetical protein